MKATQFYLTLLFIFLSFNAFSQYGEMEMNDGTRYNVAQDRFVVEGERFRFLTEEIKLKAAVFGIGAKKYKKELMAKSKLVNISDIKIIHTNGNLSVGNKSVADYIGIRYIKLKGKYRRFFVIEDDLCSLLILPENGNATHSYYVHQKSDEEPFQLHKSGVITGAKYKKKTTKYFKSCQPAMDYIESDLKRSSLPELVKIYNANCAKG